MKHKDPVQGQLDLFEGGGPRSLVPSADLCTSKHRGADTSRAAFESTPTSTRTRQLDKIFAYIQGRGSEGATCEECHLALGIPYTAASARITELQALQSIHDGGARRPTTHGKTARVYLAGQQ